MPDRLRERNRHGLVEIRLQHRTISSPVIPLDGPPSAGESQLCGWLERFSSLLRSDGRAQFANPRAHGDSMFADAVKTSSVATGLGHVYLLCF